MSIKKQTDDGLISAILEGGKKARSKALEAIYSQCFPSVKHYILKNNGCLDEAKDTFQEGVVAFYHNLKAGKFQRASSINSYIYSICRNIWLMKLRRIDQQVSLDYKESLREQVPEQAVDLEKLDRLLHQLGPDCRELLIAYYYKKYTMKQIKDMFDLNSEQIAKTKKYRCMKKLITIVSEKGLSKENFML